VLRLEVSGSENLVDAALRAAASGQTLWIGLVSDA